MLGMMVFGGLNLNAPLAIRAICSLDIASVHKALLLALSKNTASRALRGMLIQKLSLTDVLIFFKNYFSTRSLWRDGRFWMSESPIGMQTTNISFVLFKKIRSP